MIRTQRSEDRPAYAARLNETTGRWRHQSWQPTSGRASNRLVREQSGRGLASTHPGGLLGPERSAIIWPDSIRSKRLSAIGATDELGFKAVEDPYHVSDLHATVLHLMGMDHKKLTHFFHGLEERLTGQRGEVIKKALA